MLWRGLQPAGSRLRTPEVAPLFRIPQENGVSCALDKLKHVPQKAASAVRCGACFSLSWRVKLACRHENGFSPNSMTSGVRRLVSTLVFLANRARQQECPRYRQECRQECLRRIDCPLGQLWIAKEIGKRG